LLTQIIHFHLSAFYCHP